MDIYVLDTNFNKVHVIDTYESFIWTDRYAGYGDFEIYTTVDALALSILLPGLYLSIGMSEHIMIIEERQIDSDVDNGNKLIIRGRSLESILDRRIIWGQITLNGLFEDGIRRLIDDNAINPYKVERAIPRLLFQTSSDPAFQELNLQVQLTGDNLYDTIADLCDWMTCGWRILLNDNNQMVFGLYFGEDRSFNQTKNPYVIFSPEYENIINSRYLESTKLYKNVALVAGEGEGPDRKVFESALDYTISGLDRKEMFVDARDLSSTDENGNDLGPEYEYLMDNRGLETLAEYSEIVNFEGEVEALNNFVYGKDFFVGDIVQIRNEYGLESNARVTELVISDSTAGFTVVPTFTNIV